MLLSIMDGSFRRFIGVSILILFLNKNLEGASSNELRSKKHYKYKKSISHPSLWDTLKKHYELIFAITSGIFILAGWLFTKNDVMNVGITCYILAYIVGGYAKAKEGIEDTIEEKELNVEMLMLIAAIGAAMIGYWAEGAILIFIFALSGAMESYTLSKSQKEISALLDLQPEEALRISNGTEERVPVGRLQINDIILIKPGERVPADGTIHSGETNIDEAAITGEPIPNEKNMVMKYLLVL